MYVKPLTREEIRDYIRTGEGRDKAGSYAIRFAASFPKMAMVLSGMSDMAQMTDNINTMKDFEPINDAEREAIDKVCGGLFVI